MRAFKRFRLDNVQIDIIRADRDIAIAELNRFRAASQFCKKHAPDGGARSRCLVCSILSKEAAISRIDAIVTSQDVPPYDVVCDEEQVVHRVEEAFKLSTKHVSRRLKR